MKHRRKKTEDFNINLGATIVIRDGVRKIVHAGDSLETVPCPNWLRRRMEHNIRKSARASNVIHLFRRICARQMLEEFVIPFIRPSKKRRLV
jgi:hypothetical protein